MIVALAGGVGGAKLVDGLASLLAPSQLLAVVNTGDDFEHLGFHISPDIDTIMYTLGGRANPKTGWGLAGETWNFMEALGRLGGETWFRLGDKDLATHVRRTAMLQAGTSLTDVTAALCRVMCIGHGVAPMSDDKVRTLVDTDIGELAFQDYFVRHRCKPVLRGLRYDGADKAQISPRVLKALDDPQLSAVVICPSNPYLSIAPILAIPGMRERLQSLPVPVIAVSPILGGQAVKGPTAKIMRELGLEVSALEVARHYHGLVDGFILDEQDAALEPAVAELGMATLVTPTLMNTNADRIDLAHEVRGFAERMKAGIES